MPNRSYGEPLENPFDLRRFAKIGSPEPVNPLAKAYRGVTFGPTMVGAQDIAGAMAGPQQAEDPYVAALSRMGSNRATDAYRSHLSELPKQADYAPSKTRRLGAALTALAGSFGKTPQNAMALGEQVRDAPYRGALESWQLKGAGLKEQAGLEAADQAQQIARMKQILDYKDKQTDNERLDRAQRATEQYQRDTIAARLQQGWKQDYGPNGEILLINPVTHEITNTGIQSAKTTELGNAGRVVGQGDRRLDQGDVSNRIAAGNLGANWARVGLEGQRVGIAQQSADATTQNAATNAANSGIVAPGANDAAQTSAARTVATKHPEFAKYLDDKGFLKLPGDYGNDWTMSGRVPAAPDPATDDNYRAFLGMVEAEKQRVLNTRRRP